MERPDGPDAGETAEEGRERLRTRAMMSSRTELAEVGSTRRLLGALEGGREGWVG